MNSDSLQTLAVLRRLEVGPVELKNDRLKAPYKIITPSGVDTTALEYKYDEPVFDPSDPACRNLASMIAAQVALNYGLFTEEIIFHGPFDETDRRFLNSMAKNTAREIYVKKFLEPNPFLVGDAAKLPTVKLKSYLRAKLTFPDEIKGKHAWGEWEISRSRIAISSSGGKDSLLTFGLTEEIGKEIHPVFLNESGRHWFTALNAYRHFSVNVPNTSRVWVNSDRVFSWMLRHFPFIRPDFAQIRSDEYPLRLWTVAVFLFGILPIVKKRKIGRLLVGDEFDTTEKTQYQGIKHYSGLYDQSRYFDEVMTRYYQQKRWGISQFSILRPLSELLIERVLAKRYPHLLQLQTSCHAAHKQDDRIYPCGNCEKCRRIVAMLTALDVDPELLGYSPSQIQNCLQALADKGVHQESVGGEHLAWELHRKGRLTQPKVGNLSGKSHPELLKLRFESERSPMEAIPGELRKPLYEILKKHADGAVKRVGRLWMAIDPLNEIELAKPYPFEVPESVHSDGQEKSLQERFILAELTWPDAQERFKQVDLALLPVGSIEQHGYHLPLDTDAFDADFLSRQVAARCSNPKPLVLPAITYGVSYAHGDFSGTISISPDTLSKLVYDIGVSVAKHGITKLLIINGHGGNVPALHFAAQMINRDAHIFTCVDTGETSDSDIEAISHIPNDVHAGYIETSTSLANRPHLVKMDRAVKFVPQFSTTYLDFTSKRSVGWYARTNRISPSGVFGDPTQASADKGRAMWEVMIGRLVELVETLKQMTLDEIYQKHL